MTFNCDCIFKTKTKDVSHQNQSHVNGRDLIKCQESTEKTWRKASLLALVGSAHLQFYNKLEFSRLLYGHLSAFACLFGFFCSL